MRKSYLCKISMYFSLIELLFILKTVQNISPTLNNIIKLSDDDFIYNHISINSKGDMIIDTSSSTSEKRKFYGIKRDGNPYFGTSYYKIMSVERVNQPGRSEGEALFIKYKKNQDNSEIGECLAYIPGKDNKYVEYYFFEDSYTVSKEVNSYNFEGIKSKRFSVFKFQSDNDTDLDYIFCYKKNDFMISQGNFDKSNEYIYNEYYSSQAYQYGLNIERMVSCFFTKNKIYICFFFFFRQYHIILFLIKDKNIDKKLESTINYNSFSLQNIFYKAIHVKNEIGAFIFFSKENIDHPQIQFKRIINEFSLIDMFSPIDINIYTFCKEESLNDFIKLNDEQVCYISTSTDKKILYIVIITLYNLDSNYLVKYFSQNMEKYNIVFNKQIISNIYNGFITIAFSHSTTAPANTGSSFLILGYANSTDININIIEKIKEEGNSIDNLCFYLNSGLTIDNNLLNYTFNGTQIIDYSGEVELFVDNNHIEKNFILAEDKCIKISFPNENGLFRANTYQIEFAYIVKESMNETITNYEEKTFRGKHSNYSFIIKDDIYCKNNNCFLCNDSLTRLTGNDDSNSNEIKNRCNITIKETEFIYRVTTTSIIKKSEINRENKQNTIKTYDIIKKSEINKENILNTINDFEFQTEGLIKNISNCSLDDIIEKKCSMQINNNQISEMYDILKGQIKSNKSLVFSTEKVTFQISTLEEQKSNDPNISSIDLGKCEEKIKGERGLSENDNLIIYKIDIKSEDLSTTYVQYEIYDPKNI